MSSKNFLTPMLLLPTCGSDWKQWPRLDSHHVRLSTSGLIKADGARWPDRSGRKADRHGGAQRSKRTQCPYRRAKIGARLAETLLGAEDGQEVDFNVMASGSSVMSERSPLARTIEGASLRPWTLSLANSSTGAAEDRRARIRAGIFKGARLILRDVEAVLLEVSIIEINEGAPLLHDVVLFMKNAGFVTYDILEIHRRPLDRALNQIDIIFVREGSQLHADNRHFSRIGPRPDGL